MKNTMKNINKNNIKCIDVLDTSVEINRNIMALLFNDSYSSLGISKENFMSLSFYNRIQILDNILLVLDGTNGKGYISTTDLRSFPLVSDLLPSFIQGDNCYETLAYINGDKSMESYKLLYNIIIFNLYLLRLESLEGLRAEVGIDPYLVTYLKVKERLLFGRINNSLTHYFRKQGICDIKNTYMGFYKEFNQNYIGEKVVIATQLAEASKFNFLISQTSKYQKLSKYLVNYYKVEAMIPTAKPEIRREISYKYVKSVLSGIKIKIKKIKLVFKKPISLNIWLILGIVLCLITPILIYSFTELNLYNAYSLKDSLNYSMCRAADVPGETGTFLIQIRFCLATILFNLIVLFLLFNSNKLRGSLTNKVVMAVSGLGASRVLYEDSDQNDQHETSKDNSKSYPSLKKMEDERDRLILSLKLKENSNDTMPVVNPDGTTASMPIKTGMKNSSKFQDFMYLMKLQNPCPWQKTPSPTPPRGTPESLTNFIAENDEEYEQSNSFDNTTKKVRFNENVQVNFIERNEPNLETYNNKLFKVSISKSSNSEAEADIISHGQGHINNPNPASNTGMSSRISYLLKKFR